MLSRVVVRAEAQADLAAAFAWYEDQRTGLGLQFLDEIERCLQRIAENPEACSIVHRRFRRALTSRFPYKVFYVVDADIISIVAVLHAARHPMRWRSRARPQDI
jgi:plasmid stabilization system protein ParE